MLALKRIVTVAVMVYLLLALLFLLLPAVRGSVASLGGSGSVVDDERNFFYVLSFVGVVVLALHLITENIDSSVLRRTVGQQDSKINELKAKLYDVHQPTTVATTGPAVSYPTAASAAERDQLPPQAPPASPTTY
jgi:hypothetical protein